MFLPPVYLCVRAELLGQGKEYFYTSLVCCALFLFG